MTGRRKLEGTDLVYDIEPLLVKRAKEIAEEVNKINLELEMIQESIRLAQPAGDGSIIMYLNNCKKDDCLGCPHIQWRQWKVHRNNPKKPYLAHRIKGTPLRKIKRSGEYAECYEEVKELIKEAMALYERRKTLLAKLRRNGQNSTLTQDL